MSNFPSVLTWINPDLQQRWHSCHRVPRWTTSLVRRLPRRALCAAATLREKHRADSWTQLQGQAGRCAGLAEPVGDPYTRTGADISGRVWIDWGVYGVPETFVVDRNGRIAYKHIGPITPQALNDTILPLIRKLQAVGS